MELAPRSAFSARCRSWARIVVSSALLALMGLPSPALAQIYHEEEMNAAQIRALDRAHTVVLLPGGILEEHGPYLPSYTDGYLNQHITTSLAEAIAARPGWKVVIFPQLPLGVGGANDIGFNKPHFPATYDVRESTLRAVYTDLAADLGSQGFRWVFIINYHGAATHNRAMDQAAAYFRKAYGGHMVNISGLLPVQNCSAADEPCPHVATSMGAAAGEEDGLSIHGGAHEHGAILYLRPDLVAPGYATAPPMTVHNGGDLFRLSRAPDWPGYFGSPRLATADYGKLWLDGVTARHIRYALSILDGTDEQSIPRYAPSSGAGDTLPWVVAALTVLWLALIIRSAVRFSRWNLRVGDPDRRWRAVLLRDVGPLVGALLIAGLVLAVLPILDYPLTMLRIAPDPSYTLVLLALGTLAWAAFRLALIARASIRRRTRRRAALIT